MGNKFNLMSLTINVITFIVFRNNLPFFSNWLAPTTDMLGPFYYSIVAIIVVIVLWWLIHLSRKKNESKPLFLTNCILAVLNSFSLLYPFLLIIFLILFGMGDSS